MNRGLVRTRSAVTRRPATAADTPLLRELFADARPELTVLPMDSRLVLIDMQFRAQRRRYAAQYPERRDEILVVRGVDVGRVLTDRSDGYLHILDIAVDLGHRRQGIAAAALAELVDGAVERCEQVRVTLWGGNTAGRRLCEQAGFSVVAEADGYVTMSRG
jgi:ribosomal protein S18 acetylase RimI-like enzyme